MKREREKKSITKLTEKKRIEVLFRSQMHFMIQNIKKTALLSEHINLLTAGMEPEAADQKMQDFEMQVDLAEEKQQESFSEKAAERDFEMIITSDKKKKKKKKNEK
ncbi:uncharacterized protein BDCG_17829 [Blastomyces dermatitidis ER-3]|uniref:Uncharacterized protein n=1 Tax=Ajellomyces dermatitidis (strain ER-3 / ATCC MYA-2586) TaxID=559297 RepID=A0ABX2W0K4_AJEDR|nr:uncharacterized protein BDCG_17829 [Blastomyces dermatitidis ER-3]OAT02916.1 hypothetical protein BDCG_17829 [Blastomyces dermatitidis ER-3]